MILFYVRRRQNILFSMGNVFYALKDYDNALKLYEKSLQYFKKDYSIHYNLGLCHYFKTNFGQAKKYFLLAKKESDTKNVNYWLDKVNP